MTKSDATLSSSERLNDLLKETEQELEALQPKIETLEAQVQELRELKLAKQRLLTLKMSLSAMLENFTRSDVLTEQLSPDDINTEINETKLYSFTELSALKTFHPDEAFKQVDKIFKQRTSLNYEMFKAVVFSGGKATTEEIKAYLVESGAKQPQTGEGFEDVALSEISSRTNYLVRKGVLQPMGRGSFYATVGWVDPE